MLNSRLPYRSSDRMRDILRDNYRLLTTISRFDIAYGFGEATVSQVCQLNKVDLPTFLAVCNLHSGTEVAPDSISLASLMGYLKRSHAAFLEVTLPKIRHHLIEAINYAPGDEVAFLLIKFFDDYVVEVKKHLEYENSTIFEYAARLLQGEKAPDFSIAEFSDNHGHMATKLNDLKDIFICHYKCKDNERLSATLVDIIDCERELLFHFEVENRLFVPAVEKLEQQLDSRLEKPSEEEGFREEESQLALLSSREKDILRCIAKGQSNKEIAETLFLSIHTVSTHRRNICSKLGIHSAAGLAIFAILHRLVDLDEIREDAVRR